MSSHRLALALASASITLVTVTPGCGSTSDGKGGSATTPATATVGAAGGTLTSTDGEVSVRIPAGALSTAITVGIAPIASPGAGSVGQVYDLTPSGTTFLVPITLAFHVDAATAGADATGDLRVATYENGAWQPSPSTVDGASVDAAIVHFSPWGLVSQAGITSSLPDGGGSASNGDGGSGSGGGGGGGGGGTTDGGGAAGDDAGGMGGVPAGDDGGNAGDGSVDAAAAIATPNETAGTRLHPMYKRTSFADGAVDLQRVSMFDTQRNEACDAETMADGNLYCAPTGIAPTLLPSSYFSDPACTSPVIGVTSPISAPTVCNDVAPAASTKYFDLTSGGTNGCGVTHTLYPIPTTGALTGPVYYKGGSGCVADPVNQATAQIYSLASTPSLPLSSLVPLTQTEATETTASRLQAAPIMIRGTDGSKWTQDGQLVDAETGSFCSLVYGSDKALRCIPSVGGFEYYLTVFADTSCKTPAYLIGSDNACSTDSRYSQAYASSGSYDSDECYDTNVYARGTETPVATTYESSGTSCVVAPNYGPAYTGSAPTIVPITNFVTVTQVAEDTTSYGTSSTRIHVQSLHDIGGDGSDIATKATELVDMNDSLSCTPLLLADGALHCVPPYRSGGGYSPKSPMWFSDAACTQGVVIVSSPSADCARSRTPLLYTYRDAVVNNCSSIDLYRATGTSLPSSTSYYYKSGTSCMATNGMPSAGVAYPASAMVPVDPGTFETVQLSLETH